MGASTNIRPRLAFAAVALAMLCAWACSGTGHVAGPGATSGTSSSSVTSGGGTGGAGSGAQGGGGSGGTCPVGEVLCSGICADLASDTRNCGACGNACLFPHASAACADGACELPACDPGWVDCDMDPSNGCEACDHVCPSGVTCTGGVCG